METSAKVDIRKLQLLNDRIAQTIEALNQVRFSVYGGGLSHSGPMGAGQYGGGMGYPFQGYPQVGFPQGGFPQGGFPQGGFPQGGFPQGGFPFGGPQGLSHTSPIGQQYGQYGMWQQNPWQQSPWQQSPWQQNAMVGVGGGVDPRLVGAMYGQGVGGLSHTSPELDPTLGMRGGWGHQGIGHQGIGHQGIGHQGIGLDPFTAARIMQNFPFLQSPIPPVVG